MQENFQGIAAKYQYVDSHVEFKTVDKVGLADIFLYHGEVYCGNLVDVMGQENSFALAFPVWLADHCESDQLFLLVGDDWLSLLFTSRFGLRNF